MQNDIVKTGESPSFLFKTFIFEITTEDRSSQRKAIPFLKEREKNSHE